MLGGTLAGIGTLFRARSAAGHGQWTYLLDTAGLIVVLVGAVLDVRASGRFTDFDPGAGRRRALIQVACGSIAAVTGCLALGWLASDDWPAIVRSILSGVLTLGIGVGLAGILYIGWFSGGDYLERRIAQRSGEEW